MHFSGKAGVGSLLTPCKIALPMSTYVLCRQLIEILNHPYVRKRRIPLVIACNKSDEGAKAHTVDFVRKRLEKEM